MTLAEEVKQLAKELHKMCDRAGCDYEPKEHLAEIEGKLIEVCRTTVEACQGQLRVMADLAPTEHTSIYQLAIKQLRCLLPREDKNG